MIAEIYYNIDHFVEEIEDVTGIVTFGPDPDMIIIFHDLGRRVINGDAVDKIIFRKLEDQNNG